MKKICFIVPKVYLLFNDSLKATYGGAEKQVYLIGRELEKIKDIDVNYIVNDYGQEDLEEKGNIKIWKAFFFKDNPFIAVKKIISKIKYINPDYCIFRGDDKKIFIISLLLKFLLGQKYIFWISHDNLVRKMKLRNWLLFHNAFKVIAQTDDQKNMLKKKYNIESTVIRNIYVPTKDRLNTKLQRDIILWVGRSEKWKRPEVFLELAKRIQNEKFVMVMSSATGKSKYFNKIKSMAKNVINLEFVENVKHNELQVFYRRTKSYVITSKEEGFSNTMMEAMEFGCPILSLSINPDDIFDNDKIGFCAKNNLEDFISYFHYLIEDQANKRNDGLKYLITKHNKKSLIEDFNYVIK